MAVKKLYILRIIAVLLALSMFAGLLVGCFNNGKNDPETDQGPGPQPQPTRPGTQGEIQLPAEKDFDLLMDYLFADWVTNDALTMNYFLADPYRMSIERPLSTFGEILTQEKIARDKQETQELSDRLDGFNYDSLREDQQIVYDILRRLIELSRILERDEDFPYYTGYFRPLLGIQVQLPVLLAEFTFYTAEDIERYLDLISDTHRYFSDIIEFERERARRGYFLSDYNINSVTEQIESFLENREDNLLISVFDYKIDNYPGLSDEQRELYKERNKELVLENVLYAYETLLIAMTDLRGANVNTGGLADLPNGAEYAHALLRLRVGTDRPAKELEVLLDMWTDTVLSIILDLLHGEHQFFGDFMNDNLGKIKDGTPKEYIETLQRHMVADYPRIEATQLDIIEVHESLQQHTSPAFYLAPAIDRFDENVVYINPSSLSDNLFLFTVIAHESYPGHMYQTVYFLQQNPHPLRTAISNTGYAEGWATYSEMMSYFYAGLDVVEASLMWYMRLFDMLIMSCVDFGVNISGWGLRGTADFLSGYGITSTEAIDSYYNRATGVPLNSLNYSLGFIEMMNLLDEAREALGYDFELIDFHRFVLDFGPAPYPLLSKHLNG